MGLAEIRALPGWWGVGGGVGGWQEPVTSGPLVVVSESHTVARVTQNGDGQVPVFLTLWSELWWRGDVGVGIWQ